MKIWLQPDIENLILSLNNAYWKKLDKTCLVGTWGFAQPVVQPHQQNQENQKWTRDDSNLDHEVSENDISGNDLLLLKCKNQILYQYVLYLKKL